MSGLIKRRLLKELTKFTKSLKPEQIELHALRGEGELRDLELDERFLTAVLEFPLWLRLTKCTCNKVKLKVHWAHLGSKPIHVHIDKLVVRMETCEGEDERVKADLGKLSSGKYGFTDKVIDGMQVTIDSIVITFQSPGFVANVEVSQLDIHSTNPNWVADRLSRTRIAQEHIDMITTFKQVVWQNLKVEFSSTRAAQIDSKVSPLRLITSEGKLRITVRKRLSDCGVECGRLEVVLNDYLLWVLTLSQLNEAILFAQQLFNISQCAAEHAKRNHSLYSTTISTNNDLSVDKAEPSAYRKFQVLESASVQYALYVRETSHHLRLGPLHLQLYDDSKANRTSEDVCGSMQLSCNGLFLDYHPRHPTLSRRSHWPTKNRHTEEREKWVLPLLKKHADEIIASCEKRVDWKQLLESSFIFGCGDFNVQYFPTAEGQRTQSPFLSSENIIQQLPSNGGSFQVNYTTYFFETECEHKVPHPNCCLSVNPVQLTVDPAVCLWLLSFFKSVCDTLETTDLNAQLSARARKRKDKGRDVPVDVQCDFLLPTISIPIKSGNVLSCKLPAAVQVQGAKISATNCSKDGNCSTAVGDLIDTLKDFQENLFCTDRFAEFPNHKDDLAPVPEIAHRESADSPIVWSFSVDQCWAQFLPVAREDGEQVRPEQFLGSVPVKGWLAIPSSSEGKDGRMKCEANIYVIIKITDIVLARLNHSEYLFLLSLRDVLQKLLINASKLFVKGNDEDIEENAVSGVRVSAVAAVHDVHISIVPTQEQLQHDSQSQYMYSVDSRQSPAVEESTNVVEKKHDGKQRRTSPLLKKASRIGEVIQEGDEGHSPQDSGDSGNHSVADSLCADCDTNTSKDDACAVAHSSCALQVESASQSSCDTSRDIPVVCPVVQDAILASDKVPSLVITETHLSEEMDIAADYEIINQHELGSSASLSSQESALSSSSYGEFVQLQNQSTDFLQQRDSQSDSVLIAHQLPSSCFSASDVPLSLADAHKRIDETDALEDLKPDSLICKGNDISSDHTSESVTLPTNAADTSNIADGAVPLTEVSSISSAQHSNSSSDTMTVVEIRLKETQVHCQVDERGTVVKVKSPDFWLKEDQLNPRYLMDLEHKRRRRAVESAVSTSTEKAQVAVRFLVLPLADGQQEADCLASVKVSGMNSELQLPTALAMVDFIDDEVIPVPAVLPLDIEVENSRFGVRIPEFDASMALKYSSLNLTYSPTPLVFQVKKVKITRGADGAFVVNEISHERTDGSKVTSNIKIGNTQESNTAGEDPEKHHVEMVDVKMMTELSCSDSRKTQEKANTSTLVDLSQGTSNREYERMAQENSVLKQSLKQLSDEVAALTQVAKSAQMGKQALLETIASMQEQCSVANEEKQRLENEILCVKSILVAQELAAEGVAESPRRERRSRDK